MRCYAFLSNAIGLKKPRPFFTPAATRSPLYCCFCLLCSEDDPGHRTIHSVCSEAIYVCVASYPRLWLPYCRYLLTAIYSIRHVCSIDSVAAQTGTGHSS